MRSPAPHEWENLSVLQRNRETAHATLTPYVVRWWGIISIGPRVPWGRAAHEEMP